MGRPSKLTDKQWAEATRRIQDGETYRAVAATYGVAESAIRKRVSAELKQAEEVKVLAHQLVTAENKIKALPLSAQVSALSIAEDLRAMSMHLASAGKYGAATAHRLSAIANSEVQKLDDVDPLGAKGIETIKNVAVLTRTSNEASEIAVNILKANKERMQALEEPEEKPPTLEDFYGGLAAHS